MLEPAILHEEALKAIWPRVALDPRFRFYAGLGGWAMLRWTPVERTWEYLQMVSVRDGEVVGYLSAEFDRPALCVIELGLVNFTGRPGFTFSRDTVRFLRALFDDHGMYAVRWSVVVGNPAMRIYDRLIQRVGGRVTGVEHGAVVLPDQTRHDRKRYEILRGEVSWSEGFK